MSGTFRAGEDLPEIMHEIGELRDNVIHTRKGVDLLLDHCGINRSLIDQGKG